MKEKDILQESEKTTRKQKASLQIKIMCLVIIPILITGIEVMIALFIGARGDMLAATFKNMLTGIIILMILNAVLAGVVVKIIVGSITKSLGRVMDILAAASGGDLTKDVGNVDLGRSDEMGILDRKSVV